MLKKKRRRRKSNAPRHRGTGDGHDVELEAAEQPALISYCVSNLQIFRGELRVELELRLNFRVQLLIPSARIFKKESRNVASTGTLVLLALVLAYMYLGRSMLNGYGLNVVLRLQQR